MFAGSSFSIGRVFGIDIRVQWFTLFIIAFFSTQIDVFPGSILLNGLLVVAGFACVLLHELGHALTAKHYGLRVPSIVLHMFGGVAHIEGLDDLERRPLRETVITVAGPLVNLALALVFFPLAMLCWVSASGAGMSHGGGMPDLFSMTRGATGADFMREAAGLMFFMLGAWNALMLVFNLVPAIPMDGGRILRSLLVSKFGYLRATEIAVEVGKYACLAMGAWGLYSTNFMMIAIAVIIFMAGRQELAMARMRFASRRGGFGPLLDILVRGFSAGARRESPRPPAGYAPASGGTRFVYVEPGAPETRGAQAGDEEIEPPRARPASKPREITDAQHLVRDGEDFEPYREYLERMRRRAENDDNQS